MSSNRKSERNAFVHGFLVGLAGPAAMYMRVTNPAPIKVEVKKLHRSIVNPVDAMRSDWLQTGSDFDAAIKKQKSAA